MQLLLPSSTIKGIGPKTYDLLKKLNLFRVGDLVFHGPRDIVDLANLTAFEDGAIATTIVKVKSVIQGFNGIPHQVLCVDDSGTPLNVVLHFYGRNVSTPFKYWWWVKKTMQIGSKVIVSGKLTKSRGLSISSPDILIEATEENILKILRIEPIYSATAGLPSKSLESHIRRALANIAIDDHSDWISERQRSKFGWPSFKSALLQLHHPESVSDTSATTNLARQRLAFDEMVFREINYQLSISESLLESQASSSSDYNVGGSFPIPFHAAKTSYGLLTSILFDILPFSLTDGQQEAMSEIFRDLSDSKRMVRLLQGDVGSGKNIIAIFALLGAAENGRQGILLAPTELLANQHYKVLSQYADLVNKELLSRVPDLRSNTSEVNQTILERFVKKNGIVVRFISSSVTEKARQALLQGVESGEVDIIVGTQSLLQDAVLSCFVTSPGLVVIDEEQRFGVLQRDLLAKKCNILYTTATPIPRSMKLLNRGLMDISILRHKPIKKRPIRTLLLPLSEVDKLIGRLQEHIPKGSKAFWVTPCLVPSPDLVGSSAEERFASLNSIFTNNVELLHGKLSSFEKDSRMSRFISGASQIVVATTVIEVGIDVPDASLCIIERAEHFGISQLHQIRGRIGRGDAPIGEQLKECFCVLLYDDSKSEEAMKEAMKKLAVLEESDDGFVIAEADLIHRGQGIFQGLRQSGHKSDFRFVDKETESLLLDEAINTADSILQGTYFSHSSSGIPSSSSSTITRTNTSSQHEFNEIIEVLKRLHNPLGNEDVGKGIDSLYNENKKNRIGIIEESKAAKKSKSRKKKSDRLISDALEGSTVASSSIMSEVEAIMEELNSVTTRTSASSPKPWSQWWKDLWKDLYNSFVTALFAGSTTKTTLRKEEVSSIVEEEYSADTTRTSASSLKSRSQWWKDVYTVDLCHPDPFIVVIDLETTGLSVQACRITQLAAKALNPDSAADTESHSFNTYFKIDKDIYYGKDVQALTGISREMLDEVGLEFDLAWSKFINWLSISRIDKVTNKKRPLVIMAHNGKNYDFKLIDVELKRHHLFQTWCNDADISCFIDSLYLFRDQSMWSLWTSQGQQVPKSKGLGNLTVSLLHRPLDNAHNAIYDVAALADILECQSFKDIWRPIANSKQFYYYDK